MEATAGQDSSSAPRNQMASAVRPADSAGPAIWMGASDGLRREEDVVERVFEFGEEVLPGDAAPIEAERAGRVQCLLPAANRLKFNACLRLIAGPADRFEQLRDLVSPFDRILKRDSRFLQAALGRDHAAFPLSTEATPRIRHLIQKGFRGHCSRCWSSDLAGCACRPARLQSLRRRARPLENSQSISFSSRVLPSQRRSIMPNAPVEPG